MPIKRAITDVDTYIKVEFESRVASFAWLMRAEDPVENISALVLELKASFEVIKEKMEALITEENDLTFWTARDDLCRKALADAEENITLGKGQWSWRKVLVSIAMLHLIIEGATATLSANGIRI